MPPQRIAGLVREPRRMVEVDRSPRRGGTAKPRRRGRASRPGRGRRRTRRAGCRAASAKRHAGISRVEHRALALDHVPMVVGAASGLSISAAPAAKSETTASIGIPRPAIMIPVWPVARKSTSSPRSANARAIASAVYFLPSAQSVPTVSRRLPVRLQAGADRDVRRRSADVDQLAAEPLAPARRCPGMSASRECMPLTISRPASSACSSAGIQSAR